MNINSLHVILSDQRRVTEQAKFLHSPRGKALEKSTKTIANQGEKQTKTFE